jgi:hypothetical protein
VPCRERCRDRLLERDDGDALERQRAHDGVQGMVAS